MKMLLLGFVFLTPKVFARNLFTVNKNHNPKNVLHFEANIRDCQFSSPAISNYWKMGEEDGHKEGLTEKEKSYFHPEVVSTDKREVAFNLPAMEKMDSDVRGPIKVKLEKCQPKAFITVNDQEIQLDNIFVKVGLLRLKEMKISGVDHKKKVTYKLKG